MDREKMIVAAAHRAYVRCRWKGLGENEADDCAQHVVSKLWELLEKGAFVYQSDPELFSWVNKAVDFYIKSEHRRQKRAAQLLDPVTLDAVAHDPDSETMTIHECVLLLPDRLKPAFELYYVESLILKDVAARLGTSTSTVCRLLQKAHELLEGKLNPRQTH